MIHDALILDTDDQLVEGTRALIGDGIATGDLVLVGGGAHDLQVLRDAWDDDPRVVFMDVEQGYDNPMMTLSNYQRLCERELAAGRRVRVTSPLPPLVEAEAHRRWRRYEAVVNRALAPYDFLALCRYDTRIMPPELIDHARATHRRLVTPEGRHEGGNVDAALAQLAAAERPDAAESTFPVLDVPVHSPQALATLRTRLAASLPPSDRTTGLITAVNEVATNALQHGHPPVNVRLYRGSDRWLCVIADAGRGLDPYAGYDSPLPGNPDAGGRGLWLARQLCDDLTITGNESSTVVRLLLYG